ncbi:DNA-binding NarL/FixJ family response regulator [Agromyces terreus]|uniref:DNA-binding NarL/FixJ family response regulator n=1 Tax=Agromyces terreus TaxID=424795 RepID=A0A9X2KED7_9MICO|nr:response regulator transcription factor [Agromyces terreus]MCP2370512.1 DNA-binding NarL/FixJ family response regulator [Agromyces terreus]
MSIRVLVVDDQGLVRAGFRTILDSEDGIEVVGEAADGAAAVAQAAALAPDVVCMDVQMPGVDGLEATRRITGDPASTAAVLVLTTFNREDYLFEALAAGASGFLLKNSSPEQLIEAVQVVARGDALLSPDVTRRVIEAVAGRHPAALNAPAASAAPHDPNTPNAPNAGRIDETPSQSGRHTGTEPILPATSAPELAAPELARPDSAASGLAAPDSAAQEPAAPELATLTEREREVLELLAEGISNAEIARRMWVGEATVKSHVSKVLMKLGLRDRVHAVVYAYEHGVVRPSA